MPDRTEYFKQYRENNKDKLKQYEKEYRENNKEQKKQYHKQYYQTEKGKKINRISDWKKRGVIHPDFDELYEKYINTEHCELCNVELTTDKRNTKTTRVLDHDHQTGEFRNILCHSCNIRRG